MEEESAQVRSVLSIIRALPPSEWLPEPSVATLDHYRSGAYHSNFLLTAGTKTSIVRINRGSQWGLSSDQQLAREFDVLVAIQRSGKAPTPLAYFPGPMPFIVESFIEGEPFSYTARGARLVGESIAAVHNVSRTAPRTSIPIGDPAHDLLHDGFEWLQKASGAKNLKTTVQVLTEFGAGITREGAWEIDQLIHTDLIHGNILISPTDCKFVDWEGARFGPAEWDLAYFLSPVTVRWVEGQGDLSPEIIAALYTGYSSVSGRPVGELETAVQRIMPLVVFRALAWCLGHFAVSDESSNARKNLLRFLDPDFVESVTSKMA